MGGVVNNEQFLAAVADLPCTGCKAVGKKVIPIGHGPAPLGPSSSSCPIRCGICGHTGIVVVVEKSAPAVLDTPVATQPTSGSRLSGPRTVKPS